MPGAVSGAVTLPRVGGGCGFALSGQTQPAPVGHCTVLEIGDSLGADLGWGLARDVSANSGLNLVQRDQSDTGLAKPSYYDWPVQLASDLTQYHPQLVLISLGGNDEQGMQVGTSVVRFPTQAWQTAYLARVRQVITEATNSGAYVLWVGMPIMQPSAYSQGMQVIDDLFQQAVGAEPNATFIPTWSLFSNPAGAFQSNAAVNGRGTTLRQADGIHYSCAGEAVVATYVLEAIATLYHVQLAPSKPAVVTSWNTTGPLAPSDTFC